jgi:phospho-N-acetylmuramoyl-pentapeptide-transferase
MMGRLSTIIRLPFLGAVDFGFWFYPLAVVVIVGIVNAANLTDGIDGLASMVTLWAACGFLILLTMFGQFHLSIWAAALAGSLVGFLFWNFHPAKVFMGDTGSMFLGGAIAALGFCMGRVDVLILLSLVYIMEALSVMLQVSYYKLTKRKSPDGKGKRIFKMTPIHHHFEMSGWSEIKICGVFSALELLCVAVVYLDAVLVG